MAWRVEKRSWRRDEATRRLWRAGAAIGKRKQPTEASYTVKELLDTCGRKEGPLRCGGKGATGGTEGKKGQLKETGRKEGPL